MLLKHIYRYAENSNEQNQDSTTPQWVALAVVQSYNPRRKVPRSNISISDLERCLAKTSFSAAQNAGKFSPRINLLQSSPQLCQALIGTWCLLVYSYSS